MTALEHFTDRELLVLARAFGWCRSRSRYAMHTARPLELQRASLRYRQALAELGPDKAAQLEGKVEELAQLIVRQGTTAELKQGMRRQRKARAR